jgi:hypothetical protein
MRKRSLKLTAKQWILIDRMLADARLDVRAAAKVKPPVDDQELIRWMSDTEFREALNNAQAVQEMVLEKRAAVREFGGQGGKEKTPGRRDAGTPGGGEEQTRREREGATPRLKTTGGGAELERDDSLRRSRETAKPAADTASDASPSLAPTVELTPEQYDAVYRKAVESLG